MTEPQLILNVLACLMQKPSLLDESDNYLLEGYDFEKRQYEIIYSAIYNLYTSGVKSFGPQDIHLFLSNYEVQYKIFNEKVGLDVLMDATDFTDLSNWDFYYNRLKKYSALRRLKEASFPIGRFYHEGEILNFKKAQEAQERFDNATIEQIFDEILKEFFAIQDHYVSKSNNETFTAGHKLGALLEDLQRFPEIGLPLQGDIYNTICRGARRTKLYLDSGATGSGKSRRSAANAALLGYRHYYDWDKKKWIDSGFETKVQYITTEMTVDEIQTVMVAAISGIDEDVLLNGTYTMEQLKIKDQVVAYIESRDHVYIDHLPDYNIQQLKSRIRKLVTNNDVEYVFFDYIHTTPALMGEYSSFRLREDVILGMVSAALKDLCNELDVFIHTGTQLNAQWEGSKNRNQNLIRGSKAIVDKVDVGSITLPTNAEELPFVQRIAEQLRCPTPNAVTDVYKARRSKYQPIVRIWSYLDLSTGRVKNLFATDVMYNPISVDVIQLKPKGEIEPFPFENTGAKGVFSF